MAIAVVAGIAAVGGAAISAVVAGTALSFGAAAAAFAIGAGLSVVSRAIAPKPKLNTGASLAGLTATVREPATSKKIVYGRSRIGGTVVYIDTTGTDNEYLHLVIALAGHEIDAFESVYFNDEKVWQGTYQSGWGSYARIKFYKGDQTAADSDLVSESTPWTSNHILRDTAYLYVRLKYDADQFPNGIPNISAVVRGKKIYDPRQDSTSSHYDASVGVNTHRVNDSSTWTWSQNPALAVRDYLVDSKYGLGEDAALINSSALVTAADYCDISVDSNSDPIPQLQINGIVDTANSRKENIDSMLSAMGGMLVYSGGSYFIRAAQYVSPTITIDESVMVGQIQVQTRQSRRSQYNGVKGVFLSKEKNYTVADYPAQISSTYATEDGDPIYLDMPLPFVTDNEQAQRLAKIALLKSRQQTVITVPVNLAGLKFKAGDVIQITNDRLGYTNKPFEVVDYAIAIEPSGGIRVDLRCIETASSIYNWLSDDASDFLSGGELSLYDGKTTQPPTSLTATESTRINSDGAVIPTIELGWTAAADAFVDHYEVEWKQSTASTYKTVNTVGTEYEIPVPVVGVTYNTRVRAVNGLGVRSSYATANVTMGGDTTAPASPTSPGTSADVHTLVVSWTNPSDLDLSYIEVKRNSVNTEGTATVVGRSSGTSFVDGPFNVATTYYYWVRAVDNSGNASSWVSAGSDTTVAVDTADLADDSVTIDKIANTLQSTNYSAGSAGWKLTTDGTFEAGNGTFRGALTATSGSIASTVTIGGTAASTVVSGAADGATALQNGDDITDGTIGGVTITSTKLYQGTGTFNNSNTGFYLDSDGKFSLKDKLAFFPTDNTLRVKGNIEADVITVNQNLQVVGDLKASSLAIASITREMFTQDALDEIYGALATAVGGSNGDYKEASGSFTTSGGTVTLALFDHGESNVVVEWLENYGFSQTTDYTGTALQATLTFEASTVADFSTIAASKTETITLGKYDLSVYYGSTYIWYYGPRSVIKTFTTSDLADTTDYYFRVRVTNVGAAFTGITYPFEVEANEGVTGVVSTGGNADTLDNLDSTAFLRSNVDDTFDGNLVVTGDLTVNGTTVTLNTATLDVEDKNITLNYGAGDTSASADGAGITIQDAVDASTDASILWDATNDIFDFSHSIAFDGTATTTNQGRGIFWTGYDKEGVTDYTDAASIRHTTNTGGHTGSVLVITSQNDTNDGIAFVTHTSSPLKHNNYQIWTAQDFSNNSSNWDAAYTYSQVGHLPLAGGTVTGLLTLNSGIQFGGNYTNPTTSTASIYDQAGVGPTASGLKFQVRVGSTPSAALTIDDVATLDKKLIITGRGTDSGGSNAYVSTDTNLDAITDNVSLELHSGSDDSPVSIYFKSGVNAPSDFAYISYFPDYDGSGEDAALVIGSENDGAGSSDYIRLQSRVVVDNNMFTSDNSTIMEWYAGSTQKAYLNTSGDLQLDGTVTWSGGSSTNANTAYTYSQVGHLPLAGGTMTGAVNMGSNNLSGINNATAVSFLSTNGYWSGGTQRINGSGDLLNIGTITSGAITSTGNSTFANLKVTETGKTQYIHLYLESGTANIADDFTDTTTQKNYIYLNGGVGSNDPGFIMHETADSNTADQNKGVLHLVPSDDNSTNDYVSIHGTNDADCLRLDTAGRITTASNYRLELSSGSSSVYVNDNLEVEGDLDFNTLAQNGTSRIDGSGNITGLSLQAINTNTTGQITNDAEFRSWYQTETSPRIRIGRDVGVAGGAGIALGGTGGYALIGTNNTSGTNLYFKAGGSSVASVTTNPHMAIEPNTTKDAQGPYDWITVGSGSRAAALRINDVTGANYIIRAGGYDLSFMKHVDAATDYFVDVMKFVAAGSTDASIDVQVQNGLTVRGGISANTVNGGQNYFHANSSDGRVLRLRDRSANGGNIVQFENNAGSNIWELVGRDGSFYIYKNSGTGPGFKWQIDSNGDHTITGNATLTAQSNFQGLIRGTRASTSANVDYLRMEMPSWAGHTSYLKSLTWHDGGSNIAAIGAEYDGSKTNIHFHSQYNGAYKGTGDKTLSVYGNGNVNIVSGGLQIGGTTVITSARNLIVENITLGSSGSLNAPAITAYSSGTPLITLSDIGGGGNGTASGKIIFENTDGNAIGIGYTGDSTSDSDLIISTNAGGTYGGYLGLDAAAIADSQADIILEPKGTVRIATGGLTIGTLDVISSSRTLSNLSGAIASDNEFEFLTNSNGAQTVQMGGLGVGSSYASYPAYAGEVNVQNGYRVSGTTVIDSSRNLTNIASLSVGAQLYSANTIQANGQYALVVQNSSRNDNQTYYDTIFVRNNNYSSSSLQGQKAQIGFATVDGDGDHHRAQIVARRDTSGGTAGGRLELLTRTSGASPAVALTLRHDKSAEFAGSISSTGNISANGDVVVNSNGSGNYYLYLKRAVGGDGHLLFQEGQNLRWQNQAGTDLNWYSYTAGTTTFQLNGSGGANLIVGDYKVNGTTVITSSRLLENVTLEAGASGARFKTDSWHQDSGGKNRFYFENTGRTFFGSGGGYVFRDSADTGRATISNYGGVNLLSGGDGQVGSTVALAVGGTTVIDSSRNLTNIGTISASHFFSTSNVNSSGAGGINVSGGRIGWDQSGTRSWTMGAAAGDLNIYSGDGNGALNLTNNLDLKFNSGIIQNYDSADCGIVHPRENLDGVPLEAGLAYYAFNHNTSTHPSSESTFDTMERTNITSFREAGTFTNASAFTLSTDSYLVEFHGYLLVTTAGDYRFGVNADDAVDLYIDGVRVADDYGGHGATAFFNDSSRTSIYLSVGYHKLFARFEEVGGGDSMQLGWNGGSGTTLSAIPAANLYRGRDDNFKNYGGTTYGVGNLTMTGNVTAYSDEKLKSDIQTLDGSKVLEMRGVSFTKDGEAGSGVIAQELEKVAPELVHDGEYKSVAYGNLVGYLIEAVKMQQEQINELKALIKEKDNGDH